MNQRIFRPTRIVRPTMSEEEEGQKEKPAREFSPLEKRQIAQALKSEGLSIDKFTDWQAALNFLKGKR